MRGVTATAISSFNGDRVLWAIFFWCITLYIGLDFTHPVWSAQSYPDKNMRIVVPFPAGGGVDVIARIVADRLKESLGQPVVVDNRPGGSGIVGSEIVARARPDGYTLLIIAANHSVLKSMYPKLWYDPIADFAPIAEIAYTSNVVLVTMAATDITSIGDLIRSARAQPGLLTYASVGVGSTPHLATELFKMLANVNIKHVPFSGNSLGTELSAVIRGDVTMFISSSLPAVMPLVRSGKLKALAVTSAARIPSIPEIPTVAESGVPGYECTNWWGMLAPAGTPLDIVNKLNIEINRMLKSSDIRQKLMTAQAEPAGGTSTEFGVLLKTEVEKWSKVVHYAHIQVE